MGVCMRLAMEVLLVVLAAQRAKGNPSSLLLTALIIALQGRGSLTKIVGNLTDVIVVTCIRLLNYPCEIRRLYLIEENSCRTVLAIISPWLIQYVLHCGRGVLPH